MALGPAPGNVLPGGQQQPSERKQADPAPNGQSGADKEKQNTAAKEAECSDPSQNYRDCLIQLRTARATERQANVAKSTERVAWIALLFAALAAVAAWFTFWIMRKTAERQLRAYIFVEPIALVDASQIDPIPAGSGTQGDPFVASNLQLGVPRGRPRGVPGVSWGIKNWGQTPAYEVMHWNRFDVIRTDQEDSLVIPAFSANALKTHIAPGGSNSNQGWLPRVLTEQEMADIRSGVRGVYVYGRVEYRDAFKRPRVTTYRLRYANAAYPPVGPTTFSYCQEGNKAE